MKPMPWRDITVKAALAAGFFYVLQAFVLKAPQATSLVWSLSMGCAAAALAYSQAKRGH